ncbi:PA14 domain-containing protein, partial [Frankia sp. CpI1-P]
MRPRDLRPRDLRSRRLARPTRSGRALVAVVLASAVGQLVLLVAGSPAASAQTCLDDQWNAEFHSGTDLGGDPAGQRCDAAIDFDWSANGPGVTGIGTTGYSVRWTRQFTLAAGSYTASVTGDDGVRVLIDGQSVADGWGDHGPQTFTGTRTLTAGVHTIVVEYYQNAGGAMVEFDLTGGPAAPGGAGPDCAADEWAGTYFPNRALSGTGVPRCSAGVDYAWGDDGPGLTGIGADNFSARWTRTATFAAGTLAFTVT